MITTNADGLHIYYRRLSLQIVLYALVLAPLFVFLGWEILTHFGTLMTWVNSCIWGMIGFALWSFFRVQRLSVQAQYLETGFLPGFFPRKRWMWNEIKDIQWQRKARWLSSLDHVVTFECMATLHTGQTLTLLLLQDDPEMVAQVCRALQPYLETHNIVLDEAGVLKTTAI